MPVASSGQVFSSGRRRSLALLAASLLAAACGRETPAEKNVRRSVSLLHYFSFNAALARGVEQLSDAFNQTSQAHRLATVAVDHESFKASILDDLRLGNPADLYSYWAGARTRAIAEQLAPIDDILPLGELSRAFTPTVIQSAAMYGGRILLLPLTQHYVGFFYNRKVFAAHGLEPPRTWDELMRAVVRLKRRGVVPIALGSQAKWPAQFWFDYLLLLSAPLAYRERLLSGQAAFTDPEVARVFALWRDLVRQGGFNPRPNDVDFARGAATQVFRGEAAMTLMGSWLIGYYAGPEYGWREGEDFGFFPFPEIETHLPRVALGPIDGLVLPRAAKNVAGAKAVLRFFASAEAQDILSRATGALPPNQAVPEASYSPLKQSIRNEIRNCNAWAFNFDLATAPAVADIGLDLFAQFLEFPEQYARLLDRAETRLRARRGG